MNDKLKTAIEDIIEESKDTLRKMRKKILLKRFFICIILLIFLGLYIPFFRLYLGLDFIDLDSFLIPLKSLPLIIVLGALVFITILLYDLVGGKNNENEYLAYYKLYVIAPLLEVVNPMMKITSTGMNSDLSEVLPPQGMKRNYRESFDPKGKEEVINIMAVIEAEYEKSPFEIVDIVTKKVIRSYRGDFQKTMFNGLYTSIKQNKSAPEVVTVKGKKYTGRNENLDTRKEFETNFKILKKDEVVISQILTPDVMKVLTDYITREKVRIDVAFQGDNVNVRFHMGKVITPRLIVNPVGRGMLRYVYNKLEKIFKLNQQLYSALESQTYTNVN